MRKQYRDDKGKLKKLLSEARNVLVLESEDSDPLIVIENKTGGLSLAAMEPGGYKIIAVEPPSSLERLESILKDTIERYVGGRGVLTLGCDPEKGGFYIDGWPVERRKGKVFYGDSRDSYIKLLARILWCINEAGMAELVLRSFKGYRDLDTGLPVYQIRVYGIYKKNEEIQLHKLPLKHLREARVGVLKRGDGALVDLVADLCYDDECISERLNN
ncbi:MAG: hypothetical protein P3X22_006585 [Thermoprotei archaeon]|nr:hypothetical protein [Thermoprotei archaeon]